MNIGIKILVMLLWLIYFVGCNTSHQEIPSQTNSLPDSNSNNPDLIYTKHAKCRMDCREVSKNEILEIIAGNTINVNKSDYNDHPCPTIAYEGRSSDGQLLRVIIADCEPRDKVVTVIDLEKDFTCDCY